MTAEFGAVAPAPIEGTKSLDELVARYEADPRKAELLKKARAKLANDRQFSGEGSLASLRLRRGLSQALLARAVGTSQPHIARIEAGHNDPSTDLIARIAAALESTSSDVFSAIRKQRESVSA